MSSVIAVAKRDSVVIMNDGAVFNMADYTVMRTHAKATLLPKLNAAIAVVGEVPHGLMLAETLGMVCETFDELEARAAELWKPLHDAVATACHPDAQARLVIAGISETRGPRVLCVRSRAEGGLPAWTAIDETPLFVQPAYDGIAGIWIDSFDPEAFDPETDGIRVMEAQRHCLELHPTTKEACTVVGGFAQLTTIAAEGITTRIVKRWPEDKIGEKIAV